MFATVKTVLDDLPRTDTPELYQEKCDSVYRHVFDRYQGEGQSIYESALNSQFDLTSVQLNGNKRTRNG